MNKTNKLLLIALSVLLNMINPIFTHLADARGYSHSSGSRSHSYSHSSSGRSHSSSHSYSRHR